jgi:predicted Rossmann fold flavoprotein
VLQISSYWSTGESIRINLLPDFDALEILMAKRQNRTELPNLLSEYLPRRLSRIWCESYASARPLCTYSEKELKKIASDLHDWKLVPETTEGYQKAEITAGGVDTKELSSRTMETAKVPGLYFIGEVLDVSGHLGGYNLHWAWASGFTAGQYA